MNIETPHFSLHIGARVEEIWTVSTPELFQAQIIMHLRFYSEWCSRPVTWNCNLFFVHHSFIIMSLNGLFCFQTGTQRRTAYISMDLVEQSTPVKRIVPITIALMVHNNWSSAYYFCAKVGSPDPVSLAKRGRGMGSYCIEGLISMDELCTTSGAFMKKNEFNELCMFGLSL